MSEERTDLPAPDPAPPIPAPAEAKRRPGRPRLPEAERAAAKRSPGPRTIPVVLRRLQERGVRLTEGQLRRAIARREVNISVFAGLVRIPIEEEDRLVALLAQDTTT